MVESSGTYIFCYGSNNIPQLAERVGTPEKELCQRSYSTTAVDWTRVFHGFSHGWGSSVASIVKKEGANAYGLAVLMTQAEIESLDPYEGYPSVYDRFSLELTLHPSGEKVIGQAYIKMKQLNSFHFPSDAYLTAASRTQFLHQVLKSKRDQWLDNVAKEFMSVEAAKGCMAGDDGEIAFAVDTLDKQNIENKGSHEFCMS